MRIDEFSNTAGIDGSVSTTEITRFMSFGFDLAPDALTEYDTAPNRIFTPALENRIFTPALENRINYISSEDRTRLIMGG